MAEQMTKIKEVLAARSSRFVLENFQFAIPKDRGLVRNGFSPKRFFIIMHGRSGSSLLVSLLDAHPKVKCSGEILYNLATRHPRKIVSGLERYYRYRKGSDIAWGFKAKPEQIEACGMSCKLFLEYLIERDTKIISLVRENVFRSAVSVLLAGHRGGRFHNSLGEKVTYEPVSVDPKQVLAVMEQRQSQKERIQELMSSLSVKGLSLTYEKHLPNVSIQSSTCSSIFSYMGIEDLKVSSSFKKVTTDRLSESIKNSEEVVNFVLASRFSEHVSDVVI